MTLSQIAESHGKFTLTSKNPASSLRGAARSYPEASGVYASGFCRYRETAPSYPMASGVYASISVSA